MPMQQILASAGPQAEHIEALWWIMLVICTAVFVGVLVAVAWALARAPRGSPATPPDLSSLVRPERGAAIVVAVAVGICAALLVFLTLASYITDRRLAGLGGPEVQIELTAHRWWWEVRYLDADPSRTFTTANEIHIPVGKPVLVTLKADDVIHSFWVPNLAGKKDLIPGRDATLTMQADVPGTYRGQCAEFCGVQHAKMALLVFADPPEQFEAWAATERKPALEPASEQESRGREIFVNGRCALCHAIQGTTASARKAPDLTHFASRETLGAGTVPNSIGHLAGWILDPHSIKPGVNMPANPLDPDELHALLAYLEGLR
jgi:cytochrome c oxidase subunit II